MTTKQKVLLIISAVAVVWAVVATLLASSYKGDLKWARISLADKTEKLSQFQANDLVMKRDAERLAKDKAGFEALVTTNMNSVYPPLKRLFLGMNKVSQGYFESFELRGSTLSTKFVNSRSDRAKPSFTIVFVDDHGFVVKEFRKAWLLDSIGPGETRVDKDECVFQYGDPSYWYLKVD